MASRAKERTGTTSTEIRPAKLQGLVKKTRQPVGNDSGEYERIRIREISKRAELYALKVARLKSELLERKALETELEAIFAALRSIILGTRMTKEEKADCLRNLGTAKGALDTVAAQQGMKEESATELVHLNGRLDQLVTNFRLPKRT